LRGEKQEGSLFFAEIFGERAAFSGRKPHFFLRSELEKTAAPLAVFPLLFAVLTQRVPSIFVKLVKK